MTRIILIVLFFIPFSCFAQDQSNAYPYPGFNKYFQTFAYNMTVGLISSENIKPLCIGGISAGVAYGFDSTLSHKLSPYSDPVGEAGQILGSPLVEGLTVASLIAVPFTDNQKFKAFAFDLSQAFLVDYVIVTATKKAVGRERPNGESADSFPSGHAADSFVLAGVVNHYYGKKWGFAAYALAAFVGFSRVEKGKHFPSDVVMGATIGYITTASTLRNNHARSLKKVSMLPYVGRKSVGVDVTISM